MPCLVTSAESGVTRFLGLALPLPSFLLVCPLLISAWHAYTLKLPFGVPVTDSEREQNLIQALGQCSEGQKRAEVLWKLSGFSTIKLTAATSPTLSWNNPKLLLFESRPRLRGRPTYAHIPTGPTA
jgi:hypothetical protein